LQIKDKLEIVDVVVFPNPSKQPADLKIKFDVTRHASRIQVRIYTTAYRRVIEETFEGAFIGDTTVTIPQRKLSRLSSGTYYIFILAENSSEKAGSRPEELIIIR